MEFNGPDWIRKVHRSVWNAIESHPRLVFDEIDVFEELMIGYYLDKGKPFTVVMR